MIDLIRILREPAADAAGASGGAGEDKGAAGADKGVADAASGADKGAASDDKGKAVADGDKGKSVLDMAKSDKPAETPEQKTAREATEDANKKLLAADDKSLSAEDLAKKQALVKAQEDQKKADADKNKGQAPEKYEFKAPEGMTLDQALVDKVTPIFKEIGLSQEQANKFFDAYANNVKDMAKAQEDSFNKYCDQLKDETIKSLGADYEKELSYAAKARDRFVSTELLEKLNQSGFANDKDMVKMLITMGKLISEDKIVKATDGAPAKTEVTAKDMFPSMSGADKR